MRILLTSTEPGNPVVRAITEQMREALVRLSPRYAVADSTWTADAILFVESGRNKFAADRKRLWQVEELRAHPGRCFVFDFTDQPVRFLPGLYFSLPRSRFHPDRCCAMPAWDVTTELAYKRAGTANARPPKNPLLFSFRGFESAHVRARIFEQDFPGVECSVVRMRRWWDYADLEADRLAYLAEIARSKFVLAPRGLGTSTLRLYEVMRLGRVPVVLSDEWVPPDGVPWQDFSLQVAENRVPELAEILAAREADAAAMGANARLAWENWCRPGAVLMKRLAQGLEGLLLRRPRDSDAKDLFAEWSTQRFAWENGWHPAQKVARAIQRGTLMSDIRTYVRRRSEVM